ncbi:hypothetical protein K402DRAFT_388522 [Aulographum hederae CBS 113979]|uniref:Uncharacterized protein n=1 Tax=Aulographum hederae CBS 113979 TaxID=1176131 RepID=A0A6G1HFN0_9PEZI|nr:hypothetical protein K402DRAFT_388522 [Aulographum hederae CBS 113979]
MRDHRLLLFFPLIISSQSARKQAANVTLVLQLSRGFIAFVQSEFDAADSMPMTLLVLRGQIAIICRSFSKFPCLHQAFPARRSLHRFPIPQKVQKVTY